MEYRVGTDSMGGDEGAGRCVLGRADTAKLMRISDRE